MADPAQYRPRTSEIPTAPGVYRFRDEHGRVIYVGKAKNLRNRLTSYFQDPARLHPRTQQMVFTAASVQWTVVANEVEALSLEYSWIKEYDPRFNVRFKDDKSYPYLAVSMGEEIPRMQVMRGARRRGTRYFGPFSQVWAIRDTVEQLQRVFPIRTCSTGVLRRAQRSGRPCLLGYIDKCAAPCVGHISVDDHRDMAEQLCQFMSGKVGPYLRILRTQMSEAARQLDFERAARLRDDIAALEKVLERNAVVFADGTDADVFALVGDELECAVQVFHVRGGRIRGVRGWVSERGDGEDDADLMASLLQQVYAELGGDDTDIPREDAVSVDDVTHLSTQAIPRDVLVSVEPRDLDTMTRWLSERRGAATTIRVPQRGEKRQLLDTVRHNAEQVMRVHKMRRASDLTERARALDELRDTLGLVTSPLRIECFDISHTGGRQQVASMVVFEDGAPRKSEYRHFTIRTNEDGRSDDTAAMKEVLTRRFRHTPDRNDEDDAGQSTSSETSSASSIASGEVSASERPRRHFAYPPDLLVVDGGLPQVNAAASALRDIGVEVPVVGLAKRLEEVWLPGEDFPVIFPRTSPALYLLQHLRDESHRVAISHHRKKRGRAMTRSALDDIAGLGPKRQRDLVSHFGSLARIRAASVDDLTAVRGIGRALARTIWDALHPDAGEESDGGM